MAHFFADAPWLNIPLERQGEILLEPLYPRGGLLGGSPNSGGSKVSKLAALTAARKKKENEKQSSATSEGPTSSVTLLERLKSKTLEEGTTGVKETIISKPETSSPLPGARNPQSRKYVSKRQESSHVSTSGNETPLTGSPSDRLARESVQEPYLKPIPSTAPSTFARVISGPSEGSKLSLIKPSQMFSLSLPQNFKSNTKSNPFADPSPDDIVTKAQSSSKGSVRKAEAK